MFEPLITVAIIGLTAGFIFSMPVAGPINIIITSNALKGRQRFCIRTAFGASIIEFFYVLLIVVGISTLYPYYQPIIPYLLLVGSIIIFIVGFKIIKSKLKLENKDEENIVEDELKNKGGLKTGVLINLTNPTLFLGWLISTFIVFSFVSSLGINTGGLNLIINENVISLKEIAGNEFDELKDIPVDSLKSRETGKNDKSLNPFLLGITYGIAVAIGGFFWLYLYSRIIVKYRKKLNLKLLNGIVKALGVILCFTGIYLAYKAFEMMT